MSATTRYPRLALRPQAHRRFRRGNPWIYSNEIVMDGDAKKLSPGSIVTVTDAGGAPLVTAHFNAHTLIAARALVPEGDAAITTEFFVQHIERALKLRTRVFARPYYRLVHAEADGLPGLIIDRFDDKYVIQPNTAGMDRACDMIAAALETILHPRAVVVRGDSPARRLEGLDEDIRVLAGSIDGPTAVEEGDVQYLADLLSGQKTGWFFDQRENRAFMAGLSAGASVLDLYTHTGGFAIAAARVGAMDVIAVDRSQSALDLAQAATAANGVTQRVTFVRGEVFDYLESAAAEGRTWQVVIADPPPFVKSRKDLKAGLQGYRKLARLCGRVTAPNGILLIASCSHNASLEDFTTAVVRGLIDAKRGGAIIRTAGAGPDHPIHPLLPETAYLKAMVMTLH